MKSYHFSLGNSTVGPVGYCARVFATTPEEAVQKLRAEIPEAVDKVLPGLRDEAIEYFSVYFNAEAVTVDDIDDEDDVEEGQAK